MITYAELKKGDRILINHYKVVTEVRFIELSESGYYAKIEFPSGNCVWGRTEKYPIIEILR